RCESTLALLMLGVCRADHKELSAPFDEFAVLTDPLHAGSNFHGDLLNSAIYRISPKANLRFAATNRPDESSWSVSGPGSIASHPPTIHCPGNSPADSSSINTDDPPPRGESRPC